MSRAVAEAYASGQPLRLAVYRRIRTTTAANIPSARTPGMECGGEADPLRHRRHSGWGSPTATASPTATNTATPGRRRRSPAATRTATRDPADRDEGTDGDRQPTMRTATVAPTPTGTPAAGPTVLVGSNAMGDTQDYVVPGTANAFQVTAASAGTLNTVAIYLDRTNTATTIVLGMYSDNGGQPGTLLTRRKIRRAYERGLEPRRGAAGHPGRSQELLVGDPGARKGKGRSSSGRAGRGARRSVSYQTTLTGPSRRRGRVGSGIPAARPPPTAPPVTIVPGTPIGASTPVPRVHRPAWLCSEGSPGLGKPSCRTATARALGVVAPVQAPHRILSAPTNTYPAFHSCPPMSGVAGKTGRVRQGDTIMSFHSIRVSISDRALFPVLVMALVITGMPVAIADLPTAISSPQGVQAASAVDDWTQDGHDAGRTGYTPRGPGRAVDAGVDVEWAGREWRHRQPYVRCARRGAHRDGGRRRLRPRRCAGHLRPGESDRHPAVECDGDELQRGPRLRPGHRRGLRRWGRRQSVQDRRVLGRLRPAEICRRQPDQ